MFLQVHWSFATFFLKLFLSSLLLSWPHGSLSKPLFHRVEAVQLVKVVLGQSAHVVVGGRFFLLPHEVHYLSRNCCMLLLSPRPGWCSHRGIHMSGWKARSRFPRLHAARNMTHRHWGGVRDLFWQKIHVTTRVFVEVVHSLDSFWGE